MKVANAYLAETGRSVFSLNKYTKEEYNSRAKLIGLEKTITDLQKKNGLSQIELLETEEMIPPEFVGLR